MEVPPRQPRESEKKLSEEQQAPDFTPQETRQDGVPQMIQQILQSLRMNPQHCVQAYETFNSSQTARNSKLALLFQTLLHAMVHLVFSGAEIMEYEQWNLGVVVNDEEISEEDLENVEFTRFLRPVIPSLRSVTLTTNTPTRRPNSYDYLVLVTKRDVSGEERLTYDQMVSVKDETDGRYLESQFEEFSLVFYSQKVKTKVNYENDFRSTMRLFHDDVKVLSGNPLTVSIRFPNESGLWYAVEGRAVHPRLVGKVLFTRNKSEIDALGLPETPVRSESRPPLNNSSDAPPVAKKEEDSSVPIEAAAYSENRVERIPPTLQELARAFLILADVQPREGEEEEFLTILTTMPEDWTMEEVKENIFVWTQNDEQRKIVFIADQEATYQSPEGFVPKAALWSTEKPQSANDVVFRFHNEDKNQFEDQDGNTLSPSVMEEINIESPQGETIRRIFVLYEAVEMTEDL